MDIQEDTTDDADCMDLQIRAPNFIGNNVEPIESGGNTGGYLCVVAKGSCNEI
jgi:hypothetical protein